MSIYGYRMIFRVRFPHINNLLQYTQQGGQTLAIPNSTINVYNKNINADKKMMISGSRSSINNQEQEQLKIVKIEKTNA